MNENKEYTPVNLQEKFNLFNEKWTPKIIGESNGQLIKLAKIEGEFVWHSHEKEDELFYIVKGDLELKFRDGSVRLKSGELFIVPAGKEHLPIAHEETWVMLMEPATTLHTGTVSHSGTVEIEDQHWI